MYEEYVRLFSEALGAMEGGRTSFEGLARQTLKEALGGSSFEALVIMVGAGPLQDPGAFAQRLFEILGSGAIVLCNLIERKAAEKVLEASPIPEVVKFEAFARKGRNEGGRVQLPKKRGR